MPLLCPDTRRILRRWPQHESLRDMLSDAARTSTCMEPRFFLQDELPPATDVRQIEGGYILINESNAARRDAYMKPEIFLWWAERSGAICLLNLQCSSVGQPPLPCGVVPPLLTPFTRTPACRTPARLQAGLMSWTSTRAAVCARCTGTTSPTSSRGAQL